MRATKAYIASLGTTGVLLAASILMLAVVSAVVAFDRWPGGHVDGPVQTLVLNEKAAPIRVSAHSSALSLTPTAHVSGGAVALVPRARTGGTVPAPATGRLRTAPVVAKQPAPAVPQPVSKTVQNVQNTAAPIFGAVSNPRTTAGQVADGAQAVTNAAGGSLTAVSPDAGSTVTAGGAGIADAVRQVPLPDQLIPGY